MQREIQLTSFIALSSCL
jgi:hypothetical protein